MHLAPARLDGGVHPGHPAGMETHSHVGSKAEWEQIGGDLPQYETAGPDGIITGVQRAWRRRSAPQRARVCRNSSGLRQINAVR